MEKEIILYHGSNRIITCPQYGIGSRYNDYGMGFYCTQSLNLAKEWAVDDDRDGYANEYAFNTEDLTVLDLSDEKYNMLHWLAILLQNRLFDVQSDFGEEAKQYLIKHFDAQYQEYDVIIGYLADDSYFSFAQDFLNNAISLSVLSSEMRLGKLGKQMVLKSEKAFRNIQFQQAIPAEATIWLPQKRERDSRARRDYFASRKVPWKKGEIYMMQILEEEMEADDARLR